MVRPNRSAETRARIVEAASTAFRAHGYHATGVDAVMAQAGLTHGGFYAHFSSKAELLRATVEAGRGNQLFARVADLRGRAFLAAAIDEYLSPWHRDHPEAGCLIPTLGAELPRLDPGLGGTVGGPVRGLAGRLAEALPPPADSAPARAAALLALLVGGVVTARTLAVADSDRWLADCRTTARRLAGLDQDIP